MPNSMRDKLRSIKTIFCIILPCILFASCYSLRNSVGVHKGFVVTEALALEIGKAVLKHISGEFFYEETLTVKEVKKQKLFVVSFTQEGFVLGGDLNVAINKKNGKILKIWGGE